jgi:uncharacterized SAM-binding protein YcdF (DUF218 family)
MSHKYSAKHSLLGRSGLRPEACCSDNEPIDNYRALVDRLLSKISGIIKMMLTTLIKTLLLPPAMQIMLILLGLLLWRYHRGLSRSCLWAGLLSLWLLSLPVVSGFLHAGLEAAYSTEGYSTKGYSTKGYSIGGSNAGVSDQAPEHVQAIVVLGAGRHYRAEEYGGGDTLSQSALWRLRYGAYLAKRWNLPMIVSGGRVRSFDGLSEAQISVDFLQNELGVSTIWAEDNSRNTWENAHFTKTLLDKKGIVKVALVTHAYHMRRSAYAFDRAGVQYIPMPTGSLAAQAPRTWWGNWLPTASGLARSYLALHEYLGWLFYQLK